jgi:GDSL-like lipase/acylhydrolase family protein
VIPSTGTARARGGLWAVRGRAREEGLVLWFVATAALADPVAVLALGDGLVAAAPAEGAKASSVPGGWVPVLADCLQERAPQRFSVVDRVAAGETLATAHDKLAGARELGPDFIVVALGARELAGDPLEPAKLRGELDSLVADLRQKRIGPGRRPTVLLLSAVPPTLSQVAGSDPALQVHLDERAASWNQVLADEARTGDGVVHVDLLADWPRDGAARSALTVGGWSLSDQGHAKVAAAVCDALLAIAKKEPTPQPP